VSEIDPLNWSDERVNDLLPTGTVTLLLADVEGSTRLWETLPEETTAAVENLDPSAVHPTRCRLRLHYSEHRYRPSCCASECTPDRCSCATKATTSAQPSIGLDGFGIWHMGPDRPVGHYKRLGYDLGSHTVRDLPRPEHVAQLCHPDPHNEFAPLRTSDIAVAQHLPAQPVMGRICGHLVVGNAAGPETNQTPIGR
jgi:hypothetical protein